jgi:hypothetical protein
MSASTQFNIKRKPLPTEPSDPPPDYVSIDVADVLEDYFDEDGGGEDSPPLLAQGFEDLSLGGRPPMPPRPNTIPLIPVPSELSIRHSSTTVSEVSTASKSFWKTAVDETVHFAGGLVSHPFEATKHFSILRHSSGLVYYRGPSTNVVITIFADASLPPERSLWLQRKGFSGNMGMNASALLGTSGNWIDVTPTSEASPSEMPESDERAWQRDMKKMVKKASKHKYLSRHVARETCIVRIPAAAADGYLRVIVCAGEGRKKVLCPSPIFRIASTSSDVSIFRGASLSTMPLEVGLKAASVVGATMANRYIGPAKAVLGTKVQKYAGKLQPGFVATRAEQLAYAKTGLQSRFESLEQNYNNTRDVTYDPLHMTDVYDAPPEVVGLDSGPEKPFPIKFDGTVVKGTGQSQVHTGIPTANLSGVPGDLLLRLSGVYFGWVIVQPRRGLNDVSHDWHEAIITIGPSPYAAPKVVAVSSATVHILHDFGTAVFIDARLKVIIMAYLHPAPKFDKAQPVADLAVGVTRDIDITLASLSRENWGPQMTVQRLKTEKSSRSLSGRYIDARTQVQKHVDSIPMHWAGVRTDAAEMMDKAHGNGGIFIRR